MNYSEILQHLKHKCYRSYLWVMLAPEKLRAGLLAYAILDEELAGIPEKVTEPMLGFIRYSWWQESLELIEKGELRQHPALELWKTAYDAGMVSTADAIRLVEIHRGHFEDVEKADKASALAASRDELHAICSRLIEGQAPEYLLSWARKTKLIDGYEKAGKLTPGKPLLLLRLLFT